jgi:NADH-quinone oxidoreductase subunit F
MRIVDLDGLNELRRASQQKLLPGRPRIGVGLGTCGIGNGARAVFDALAREIAGQGVDALLVPLGCFGWCAAEPLVNVHLPGRPLVMLGRVTPDDAPEIVRMAAAGEVPRQRALLRIERWDHLTGQINYGRGWPELPLWDETAFFRGQQKIVLRDCGLINPDDIDEYVAVGGYQGFAHALHLPNPGDLVEEIKRSRLRGRGGAGYPTGVKWDLLRRAVGERKVLICNADEGDPGAYMNRNEIESDPHMLIEGMLIGALATGADTGIVYLRAEYPLAVERLRRAIDAARVYGLLGERILGSAFSFDIRLVEGAGAFVCGEETAMIASLEGRAGRPRPRPPFPAQQGLWGWPTNINNVETWCAVPAIVARGAAWYAGIGAVNSPGTKVFSLVGKVARTGLVELPLGTPIKTLVYDIGGGAPLGKSVKAVQSGGPSGGCIAAADFATPIDYESLGEVGAIMGSGGMVVMDDDNCMVDVARYFLEFTHAESCGKCVPCRAGLEQARRLIDKVVCGEAHAADLLELEQLALAIRDTSLCGLGQSAPNPVLTTLRHFRREYDEHLRSRRCRAGVCEALFVSPCENACPLHMRIPQFLDLMRCGDLRQAAAMVWLDNPLPASTGRICQHPCESRCRRAGVDAPVNMREVHRFIADQVLSGELLAPLKSFLAGRRLASSGRRVAVVGAGPAGLSAAYYLALLGHAVRVFEARDAAGGMLRYALPRYRLPKDILAQEIDVIASLGVDFCFGQKLGAGLSLDVLCAQYDAVFLAIGTWRALGAGIPGEDAPRVWHAIAFLEHVARAQAPKMGGRVVVVGGGNAAVDSARTALRLGSAVTIAYRRAREDMPAIADEVEQAQAEGVELTFLASPQRIVCDARGNVCGIELRRTRLGDYALDGRRRPVSTDETFVVECDTVILAIGERPDAEALRRVGIHVRDDDTAAVDWVSFETNRARVFAGGDLATGASNVSSTMATGKSAARAIDAVLCGGDRLAGVLGEGAFAVSRRVPQTPEGGARQVSPQLTMALCRGGDGEVMLGLSPESAHAEASRCLRCDVREIVPKG